MRECILQQVRGILPQEHRVADVWIGHLSRIKQRRCDRSVLHQLEQSRQQQALQLETTLVVRIREDEEDVLQNAKEVLLEEEVGVLWLCCGGEVVDDLEAKVEASVGDVAHGVFDGPDNTVHEELELSRGDGEEG